MMELNGVATGFGSGQKAHVLLTNLAVTLRPGEFTVLVGPNGAGKSTLMRTIAGLQPALAGSVRLDGEDVHRMAARARARKLAVVLTQQIKLWGLTARQMVAIGRHPHTSALGTLTSRDHAVVEQALIDTGSIELAERQLAELSDGERQRVMVARALAQQPRTMILDEVTAFLDLPHRVEIMLLLRRLARQSGCALLLSTHDLELALKTADWMWVIKPGNRFAQGTPSTLAADGIFDDLFASQDLYFDRLRRTFAVRETSL